MRVRPHLQKRDYAFRGKRFSSLSTRIPSSSPTRHGHMPGMFMVGEGDVCFVENSTEIVVGSHPAGNAGRACRPTQQGGVLGELAPWSIVPPSRAKCWACLVQHGEDGLFQVLSSIEVVTT